MESTTKNAVAFAALQATMQILEQRSRLQYTQPRLTFYGANNIDQGIAEFLDKGMAEFQHIYGEPTAAKLLDVMKTMSGIEETLTANNKLARDAHRAALKSFVRTYFPEGEPLEVKISSLGVELEFSEVICIAPSNPFDVNSAKQIAYGPECDQIRIDLVVRDMGGTAWAMRTTVNSIGQWFADIDGPIPTNHPVLAGTDPVLHV